MKNTRMSSVNMFIGFTFLISALLAIFYHLLFPEKDPVSYSILAIVYMFMPTLGVVFVDKWVGPKKSWKSLAINFNFNGWMIWAILLPLFLAVTSLFVNILWPEVTFSPDMKGFYAKLKEQSPEQAELTRIQLENLPVPAWVMFIGQALLAGLTINAVAAFGEEFGWRGFMVREYKNLKFWNAALRIGIVWGKWQAPLILMGLNYPMHSQLGVGLMVIWCILLSPLFLYIRMKTHSVIGASIMHGVLNGAAGFPLIYIIGGDDIINGVTGFSGFIALLIFILGLIIFDLRLSNNPITNKRIIDGIKNDQRRN